jgi:transposase InsO family protein
VRVKDARLARVPPRQRPHYPPADRFAILALHAARGWSAAEVARRFLLTDTTIAGWMKRLDEGGEAALVRTPLPVNRFPDFVRGLVAQLRAFAPAMGKVRIAQLLARAGLHLAPTTVRRWTKAGAVPPAPTTPAPEKAASGATVIAKRVDHVWGIDLTVVPTSGWWSPWKPHAVLPVWPFCWWITAVVDAYSRAVVAFAVFRSQPSGAEIADVLQRAVVGHGTQPAYIVSDQGVQFRTEYRDWCRERGITPRYGAVGRYGSVAIIERFWRSLKAEAFGPRLVPMGTPEMRTLLSGYVAWYNAERPHQGLDGVTPLERATRKPPAKDRPRLEPRARYPDNGVVKLRKRRPKNLRLRLVRPEGAPHLPIVRLDAA